MSTYTEVLEIFKEKPGGIIEAYHALQKEYNYIPREALAEAAKVFGLSEPQAYGVATFYSYLSVEPRGTYIVRVCESAPCHIAGADKVIAALEEHLGVKTGETTLDGRFTLELTECVGQCQGTVVVTINSTPYVDVTPDQIPAILGGLE
jgi:NADH-quinone oxidoreductase subunit E